MIPKSPTLSGAMAALALLPAVGSNGELPIAQWPIFNTAKVSTKTGAVPTIPLSVGTSNLANTNPDQWYYWTTSWQREEAQSRAELLAGKGVRFGSAEDAISWLLTPDA